MKGKFLTTEDKKISAYLIKYDFGNVFPMFLIEY